MSRKRSVSFQDDNPYSNKRQHLVGTIDGQSYLPTPPLQDSDSGEIPLTPLEHLRLHTPSPLPPPVDATSLDPALTHHQGNPFGVSGGVAAPSPEHALHALQHAPHHAPQGSGGYAEINHLLHALFLERADHRTGADEAAGIRQFRSRSLDGGAGHPLGAEAPFLTNFPANFPTTGRPHRSHSQTGQVSGSGLVVPAENYETFNRFLGDLHAASRARKDSHPHVQGGPAP